MNTNLASAMEEENLGGLRSARIIRLVDCVSIPDTSLGSVSFNDITLADGCEFQDIYFTPETGYFTDQEIQDSAGAKFKKEVGLEIPKIRTDIISALKSYENCRNVLWLTDMNGIDYLVFPLKFVRKKQIPGQFSQKNGITIVLSGESKFESPVLTDIPVM